MSRLGLYAHALRVARPRQLRARVLRPLRRRRFPRPSGAGRFEPLAADLWRGPAFSGADDAAGEGSISVLGKTIAYPPRDWSLPGEPRLRRFHLHYGDEILGWARRGDLGAAAAGLAAWIEGNPPAVDDAWHPYPLSTRVGNWIAACSLAPELATAEVVASLRRQLAALAGNVEDDVLGNHVIRNARALVLGGAALGDGSHRAQGLALLQRELPEQILPDGGHYERSPVYHLVVLLDLLEARLAAEARWLDEPIARMERFAAALTRPDGAPALFNDGALDLAPELELPDPPAGLTVFPETGYAVLREGGVWLAFDCGQPGPAFLPAHAHADALSFQLWVEGRPVVIDPGTSTYEPGGARQRERATASHSTVAVDGRSQFELWGAFRSGALPVVRLLGSSPLSAEVVTGTWRHRRQLRVAGGAVEVVDEVAARGSFEARWSVPLADPRSEAAVTSSELDWRPAETTVAERFFAARAAGGVEAARAARGAVTAGWRIDCRDGSP